MPAFHHQPLDHSIQAIRLVQILPELSSNALIQCKMRSVTTDTPYICLSYRWGNPSPNQQILVNNQPFVVRQNLFDFLNMIRGQGLALPPFWIDAMCIDQTNLAERNQQVAQMGDIYARALAVHSWLGPNPVLVSALRILQEDAEKATLDEWAVVRSHQGALESLICKNEYWNRAWIVQEIFLAKAVVVWVDTVSLQFERLHWTLDYFYLGWKESPIAQFKPFTAGTPHARSQMLAFSEARRLYFGTSLVSLLANFYNMSCELPRDRVFSLLSMCSEGRAVQVDYGTPDSKVALEVLQCCKKFHCICAPLLVSRCLDIQEGGHTHEAGGEEVNPYLELDISRLISAQPSPRHGGTAEMERGRRRLRQSRSHYGPVFTLNGKYYRVDNVPRFRGLASCSSFQKLATHLHQLKQIVEISKTEYDLQLPEFLQGYTTLDVPDDVSVCLLAGKPICVNRLYAGKHEPDPPRFLCFALPHGLHLEQRGPQKRWVLRIALWALKEALSPVEKMCDTNTSTTITDYLGIYSGDIYSSEIHSSDSPMHAGATLAEEESTDEEGLSSSLFSLFNRSKASRSSPPYRDAEIEEEENPHVSVEGDFQKHVPQLRTGSEEFRFVRRRRRERARLRADAAE